MVDPGQGPPWRQQGPKARRKPFRMNRVPVGVTGENGLETLPLLGQVLQFENQEGALSQEDLGAGLGHGSRLQGTQECRPGKDAITVGVGDQQG